MDAEFERVGDMGLLIGREVAAGFASRQEMIALALQRHGDPAQARALRELAEELAGHAFHRHLTAQRDWPLVTDCDRLDLAFARLEEQGIVTRHHASGSGMEAIDEAMDQVVAAGKPVRGYAFYRQKDTEAALEGLGLYVDYGAVGDDADDDDCDSDPGRTGTASVRIGRQVANALRQQGLVVEWEGTAAHRIRVALAWKRRRPWSDEA